MYNFIIFVVVVRAHKITFKCHLRLTNKLLLLLLLLLLKNSKQG